MEQKRKMKLLLRKLKIDSDEMKENPSFYNGKLQIDFIDRFISEMENELESL
jgi:hypothetical protein